jgi:hypothetical protein
MGGRASHGCWSIVMRRSAGPLDKGRVGRAEGNYAIAGKQGRAEGRARAVARYTGRKPLAAWEKAERRGHEGGCARKKGSEARRKKAHLCTWSSATTTTGRTGCARRRGPARHGRSSSSAATAPIQIEERGRKLRHVVGKISAWAVREKINRARRAGGWDPRAAAARRVDHTRGYAAGSAHGAGPRKAGGAGGRDPWAEGSKCVGR